MQHISRDVMVSLLEGAQVYDSRHVDKQMVDSWLLSAQLAGWRPEAVAAAIATHYAMKTDRIMPGHVTAFVRSQRPACPSMDELRSNPKALAAPSAPPASAATRAEAVASVRAKLDVLGVESHRHRPRVRAIPPDSTPNRAEREPRGLGDMFGGLTRNMPHSAASVAAGRAQRVPQGGRS